MLSNVISSFYKVFGQTFIRDDRFLSVVGSINSVFNCSGRLVFGLIMDKFAYKVSMSIEAVILVILTSTFYLTSLIGVTDPVCEELVSNMSNMTTTLATTTATSELCEEIPTSITTKVSCLSNYNSVTTYLRIFISYTGCLRSLGLGYLFDLPGNLFDTGNA